MASQVFEYIFLVFFLHFSLISSNKILSNVEFLKSLNGVQKGDNVKGVSELKNYLAYLGYLNYNHCSSNHTHKNKNIFDNSLEFALKKYQNFYNLNATGFLDASTIAKLHEPRCDVPDFFNDGDNPFRMVSRYSFFYGRPKWRKRKLTYAFNVNVKNDAILAFEHAMQEWASVTRFKFFRVKSVAQANIRISFMRGHHGGGLAHSFAPPDGRVHFDAAQNWSTSGAENAFDIQTVGLHELGHVLGLGHSNVHQAVMHATIAPGERKKLHEDDIKGIKALYKLK
ncbi:metalloendoproteinase 1 [Phtheirospermum japonicum]|uniref:Metalloendoproteinase 1 n=1 Tax=Phtheirospermum japonicum TaxID=374723 RepID=A0A830CMC8_9LAMI|nr:metalloendoproteinase 1 [Phtheirospermum japonicum]